MSSTTAITREGSTSSVYTYHCICTTLILLSRIPIESLPTRRPDPEGTSNLDRAMILPLTQISRQAQIDNTQGHDHDDPKTEPLAVLYNISPPPSLIHHLQSQATSTSQYSSPKPIVIKRQDGFEKRVIFKCTRCTLVIGYTLVEDDRSSTTTPTQSSNSKDDDKTSPSTKTHTDIVYILPDSLIATETMKTQH